MTPQNHPLDPRKTLFFLPGFKAPPSPLPWGLTTRNFKGKTFDAQKISDIPCG
jgi:hypothetical protein